MIKSVHFSSPFAIPLKHFSRSRLFEFWTGNGRLPLGGVEAIDPKPRLQIMVSQEKQYLPATPQQKAVEFKRWLDLWVLFDIQPAAKLFVIR